jgi:hypothetical protein
MECWGRGERSVGVLECWSIGFPITPILHHSITRLLHYSNTPVWLLLLVFALSGCVSKSKANAQARAAYIAGQQQAMARMQQAQAGGGPCVTVNGEVRNRVVPWTQGMTLAQVLVAAEYTGTTDPGQIIIVHQGVANRVDPAKLLNGVDIPLQPGDIVQLMPRTQAPNP